MMKDAPKTPAASPEHISPEFRNGSLTAISVIVGFSLSFLSRWAGTPGKWHGADLFAVAMKSGSEELEEACEAQQWPL